MQLPVSLCSSSPSKLKGRLDPLTEQAAVSLWIVWGVKLSPYSLGKARMGLLLLIASFQESAGHLGCALRTRERSCR